MTFHAYTRVSTNEQGLSLSDQAHRLGLYHQTLSAGPWVLWADPDTSASIPLAQRPGGSALLRALQPKDHVAIVRLDRAFRRTSDCLSTVEAWSSRGIVLHILDFAGGSLNLGTAMGKFFLTVMAAIGEMERTQGSERTKAALTEAKRQGTVLGRAPYGFVRTPQGLAPEPGEQLVLQHLAAFPGASGEAQARCLNADGFRNRSGRPWTGSQVCKIRSRKP